MLLNVPKLKTLLASLLLWGLFIPSFSLIVPAPKPKICQLQQLQPPTTTTSLHATELSQAAIDLGIAGVLGTTHDPLMAIVLNNNNGTRPVNRNDNFVDALVHGAADSVSLAANVYGILILADIAITNFLPIDTTYIPQGFLDHPRRAALQIALTIWAALTACTVKRTLLLQSVAGKKLGRVTLFDRLGDFIVINLVVLMICDELEIDIGTGLQSVLSAGGVGALVFSLAAKDLAEQIVSGFAISAWEAINQGDEIVLGDGTQGTVHKVGLVETEVTGYDNIIVRIPNSELAKQRVSNLSRIQQSRVQPTLRFKYSDLPILEHVLADICTEIKASCGPKLITDGSKAFNALLTGYEPDHVSTVVNCHFDIPPSSGEYFTTRQEVLLAISRAVEKNNVEFAIPAIKYQTEAGGASISSRGDIDNSGA